MPVCSKMLQIVQLILTEAQHNPVMNRSVIQHSLLLFGNEVVIKMNESALQV